MNPNIVSRSGPTRTLVSPPMPVSVRSSAAASELLAASAPAAVTDAGRAGVGPAGSELDRAPAAAGVLEDRARARVVQPDHEYDELVLAQQLVRGLEIIVLRHEEEPRFLCVVVGGHGEDLRAERVSAANAVSIRHRPSVASAKEGRVPGRAEQFFPASSKPRRRIGT